jgi:hypothetical protein
VTVLQLVRGPTSARLGLALSRWNPVEQTGLCIYICFRTYRSELFNRVLSNQPTIIMLFEEEAAFLHLFSNILWAFNIPDCKKADIRHRHMRHSIVQSVYQALCYTERLEKMGRGSRTTRKISCILRYMNNVSFLNSFLSFSFLRLSQELIHIRLL